MERGGRGRKNVGKGWGVNRRGSDGTEEEREEYGEWSTEEMIGAMGKKMWETSWGNDD